MTIFAWQIPGKGAFVSLTHETRAALNARAESRDAQWKNVARELALALDRAEQAGLRGEKTRLLRQAAADCGEFTYTLRDWVRVYRAVGDELLAKYDGVLRYAHWRIIVDAARRSGRAARDVATQVARDADRWGGAVPSPDTLAATLGKPKPQDARNDPFESALQRARLATATLKSNAPGDVVAEVAQIADLVESVAAKTGIE
jgi:hypothetical protein